MLERQMRLIDLFWKSNRGSMVADIAKAGAAIALLSVIAANLISNQLDRERLAEVASAAATGKVVDPMVTGSLRKAANEAKLDPCALPR